MNRTIMIDGFWDRVDQTCEKSGLTKNEIARRCGFERKILFHYGKRMPNSGFVARFCAETGVSADWLLGLERRKS